MAVSLAKRLSKLFTHTNDTSCVTKDCCKLLDKLTAEISNLTGHIDDIYNTREKTEKHLMVEKDIIKRIALLYLNKIMILLVYKNSNDPRIDAIAIQKNIEDTYKEFKDKSRYIANKDFKFDPNIVKYIDEQIKLSRSESYTGGSKKSVRKHAKKTRKSRR